MCEPVNVKGLSVSVKLCMSVCVLGRKCVWMDVTVYVSVYLLICQSKKMHKVVKSTDSEARRPGFESRFHDSPNTSAPRFPHL